MYMGKNIYMMGHFCDEFLPDGGTSQWEVEYVDLCGRISSVVGRDAAEF